MSVLPNNQFVAVIIYGQHGIRCKVFCNDFSSQQCFDFLLNPTLQRTSTIVDIIAVGNDIILGCIRYGQRQLFVFQPLSQAVQHQVYNLIDFRLHQRFIEYNLIQTVQEFRTERLLQQLVNLLASLFGDFAVCVDAIQNIRRT